MCTPVEMQAQKLLSKNIGISISDPEIEVLNKIGQNREYLEKLSQVFAKYLLGSSATLIYGGDLRKNGFTEKLILEAKILKDRLKSKDIYLKNYLAWPIYLNDSQKVKNWKAEYKGLLKMINVEIDKEVEGIWCEESAVQRGSHRFIQTRIRPLHAVQYADSRKV